MRPKTKYLLFGLIISISVIISLIFIFASKEDLSFSSETLEECKTLKFNSKNAINIVYFSDEQTAQTYTDFLLGIAPFEENENKFNFYYIDSYEPECEFYRGIALLCHSRDVIKKAASCPNDYIIVIKKESTSIRSSSFMNVLSINENHPETVLPHEIGHALSNLAEEYVDENAKIPRGSKNCVSICDDFPQEDIDGCFTGCTKAKYARSVEEGIMRTLNSITYGTLNELLISETIAEQIEEDILPITGFQISDPQECADEEYYLIGINFENSELTHQSLEQGCPGENGYGGYPYSVVADGALVKERKIDPELLFTSSPAPADSETQEIVGDTFANPKEALLRIPTTGESLQITNQENKIIEINLEGTGARPCLIS